MDVVQNCAIHTYYCKKLRKDENGIALISLNKKYAPIPVREEDEFRIAGIVVG